MSEYLSYREQALHYFNRPHEHPALTRVDAVSAWRSSETVAEGDWRFELSGRHIEELDEALAHAKAAGKPMAEMTAADFPLPTLTAEVSGWRRELMSGRGFKVITGVPVDRWEGEDSEIFFWCLGLHLGRPGAQNVYGDLLGHVTDTGDDATDPFVRKYRTADDIAYHCDAADVVGLLCLNKAESGGLSRIVSSVAVYNELLARAPELVERLYEPFLLDIRNEDESGEIRYVPIPPCRFADGTLRTFYHSDYFRSVVRHDDVPAFTDEERTLLDTYEEIARDPDLFIDMDLSPGDIQLLSNHFVLHARTRYKDHEDPRRKRHLLRLWLSVTDRDLL